ncbi:MAG TPA: cytochrome c biogenesis protein CcsA [Candidatus Dormibacteraeota bacterium]
MTDLNATLDRALRLAAPLAVLGLLLSGWLIFLYAPPDAVEGNVQRIFYLHVSAAIAAYMCFAAVVFGSALYLWRERLWSDRLARASAQVGLVFTTVCLVMGSLWGASAWGTYWQWGDARLDSTLVLWLVYAAYLLLRRVANTGRGAARLAAVVGIVGFVDIPVVHFSVLWWRTLHPGPVLETGALPASMLLAFMVTMLSVLLFAAVLVAVRYRIDELGDEAGDLRAITEAMRVA